MFYFEIIGNNKKLEKKFLDILADKAKEYNKKGLVRIYRMYKNNTFYILFLVKIDNRIYYLDSFNELHKTRYKDFEDIINKYLKKDFMLIST